MINALNTGHSGSLATIHANTARLALSRLATLVLMAGAQWPVAAIKSSIVDAIHYVVHVCRRRDGGGVTELFAVAGYHAGTDSFATSPAPETS